MLLAPKVTFVFPCQAFAACDQTIQPMWAFLSVSIAALVKSWPIAPTWAPRPRQVLWCCDIGGWEGWGWAARLSDSCTQAGLWRPLGPQVHTGTSFGYRGNLAFGKYFPAFMDDQILPRYKIYTELFERPQSNFLPTFLHSYFLFLFLLFLYGLIKHSKRTRHIF